MQIRYANEHDAEGIAKVHVDSWKTTYKGIVDDRFLQALSAADRVEGWRWKLANMPEDEQLLVVADEDGKVYGFMSYGTEREQKMPHEGELYAVYLLEEIQGQGYGNQLFARLKEYMNMKGYTSLLVWVLEGNSAEHFYRHKGGQEQKRKEIVIGGKTHTEIALLWDSIDKIT
ncbi:N-acetyltransferase [Paenibacillus glucanolyticus]|uniref:GNAT family N-acetyltransferase n=1 Tax=Paenibacillus TaxID=44249 RepID=UPI0003E1FE0D|nr:MULTISPECIES: GNAT family N-acetyltransferase [Paenibacillus]ANA82932.1 GCN5 family acetyltransferase [Paenibacillus glucanolyticus]AVV57981.1 N-acetyltransferase [Paenibacillus glucanolyticus]AWP27141.1 N-acetyltransferase [Paenibacillus sp. Cedars]ETT34782.1 GCN5-like N-acetyltransferase [Paenibacillus sp. FSL R5-808]MDH6670533.1 L-amino acid N-acyltransferase YncA [Paenibacillus sp. LBL]